MIAWAAVAISIPSALACFGFFCRTGYRGKHRGPSPQHPAAKTLDTRPSSKPLTHTEWLHEAYFDDAPQQIHTARRPMATCAANGHAPDTRATTKHPGLES